MMAIWATIVLFTLYFFTPPDSILRVAVFPAEATDSVHISRIGRLERDLTDMTLITFVVFYFDCCRSLTFRFNAAFISFNWSSINLCNSFFNHTFRSTTYAAVILFFAFFLSTSPKTFFVIYSFSAECTHRVSST